MERKRNTKANRVPKVEFDPSRILANGKTSSKLRITYPTVLDGADILKISRGSFTAGERKQEVRVEPGRAEYTLTIYSTPRPGLCRIRSERGVRAELAFYPSHFQAIVFDWIPTLVMALLIALFLRAYVVAAFFIPSRSMEPTLLVHDRLIADKISFTLKIGSERLERGDIVIFNPPREAGESQVRKDYIKRVIGLPGDRIAIRDGKVFVNGEPLEEEYVASPPMYRWPEYSDEAVVPTGHIFVLGDNRNNSRDSHAWGFLPLDNVLGKALFIFWPPGRMGPID